MYNVFEIIIYYLLCYHSSIFTTIIIAATTTFATATLHTDRQMNVWGHIQRKREIDTERERERESKRMIYFIDNES